MEVIDESQETYDEDQIRFKISMLRSSLCDYSDAYILFKGTIAARNTAAQDAVNNYTNKKVSSLFINCISRINNTQVDDALDIDVVTCQCIIW